MTSTFHPDAPLLAIVALSKPVEVSNPRAISASLATSISFFLEILSGFPVLSSSPVNATVMLALSSKFKFANAFKAYKTTTSPPFMSLTPGP